MFDQIPLKNDLAPFHADFTPFHADRNILENHEPTDENVDLIPDQIPLNQPPAADQVFLIPDHAVVKYRVMSFHALDASDLILDQADFQKFLKPSTLFHR